MIKITVNKNNNRIERISIIGHAMYDDFGKDIVCASVSSIVITTVNAIERINMNAITVNENPFEINVLKSDEITNKLLINMISLLEELKHDYPKNIKFI